MLRIQLSSAPSCALRSLTGRLAASSFNGLGFRVVQGLGLTWSNQCTCKNWSCDLSSGTWTSRDPKVKANLSRIKG